MPTAKLIYWETAALDRGPARVKILRNMICPCLGCVAAPVETGAVVIISDRTLQEITSEDVVFLGRETAMAFEI